MIKAPAMKAFIQYSFLMSALAFDADGQTADRGSKEIRDWKEAGTTRVIRGRMDGKRNDGKDARIILENGKAIWLPTSRLSAEDQKFVSSWENINMRLDAKTVAMSTRRDEYAAAWIAETKDTADLLAVTGSEQLQGRAIGITIDNRGTASTVVVDVFWFGFPLAEKSKRVICSRATKIIQVPPEVRYTISCQAGYRYSESSLAYAHANFDKQIIAGLFVNSWEGFGYAGWAARLSDAKGGKIDEKGSQPALLRHLEKIPFPTQISK